MSAAVSVYLRDAKEGKVHKTYTSRKRTLESSQLYCTKILLDQIEPRDMLDVRGFLKRQASRTEPQFAFSLLLSR